MAAFLMRATKVELLEVANDFGVLATESMSKAEIAGIIKNIENYDEGMAKASLESIREERKSKERLEEKERERNFELEKLRIEAGVQHRVNSSTVLNREVSENETERTRKIQLSQITPKFDEKKDEMGLYLINFERKADMARVPKEEWVAYLLAVLPTDLCNMLAREAPENANNYDYVKDRILKRYKMNAEKLKQHFYRHQKSSEITWETYAHELCSYFTEWIAAMEVKTFEQLKDLIVAEQLKRRTPDHVRDHFLDKWMQRKTPFELAEMIEEYETIKDSFKKGDFPKTFGHPGPRKYFGGRYNNFQNRGASDREIKYVKQEPIPPRPTTTHFRSHGQKTKPLCYDCGSPDHLSYTCPKRGQRIDKVSPKYEQPSNSQVNHLTEVSPNVYLDTNEEEFLREVRLGDYKVIALLDTGSKRNLLREDVYRKMKNPPSLSYSSVLSGIGRAMVRTKGSFRHVVSVDDHTCQLDFHVIPTRDMDYEAIIGSAFLRRVPITSHSFKTEMVKKEPVDWVLQVAECTVQDEFELNHIQDPRTRSAVEDLVSLYKPEKAKTTEVSMRITLEDEHPVYQRARRLSFAERQEVNKQIDDWIKDGIVRPSSSDYASPIVLVKKKDLTMRLCVDYRKLNRKLIKDRFPLPLIDDVLDRLVDAKVFTTLDLKNGFFHVPVEEGSRKYTSFIVPDGQYEFLKVPFGLSTSPSVFQRYVNSIFRDLMRAGIVVIYMDDLIIPSIDEAEGVEKLKVVLQRASEYGLEIKTKKCQFLRRSVEFLGHIIADGTISPSSLKTQAVSKFPIPSNVKQVQSFLGLTGYFRKFIKDYSKIAKPLSDLLRKDNSFKFDADQIEAYQKLKDLLATSPVLHLFKPGKKTELHTDASKHGFGAILLQEADDGQLHPVHYMSKKTSPAEEKYSSYELEVLAIVEALKKLRVYLMGHKFKVVTDCSAFQKTMDKKDLVTRITRWALFHEDFNYEIVHRPAR